MKKTIFALSALALMMTACQSNSYKVNGIAEGFSSGDTLFFTEGLGELPTDTIIIKEGKFTIEGKSDSVRLCAVASSDGAYGVLFFNEPGTINITLSTDKPATVGGTRSNDGWNEINQLQEAFSKNTDSLLQQIYTEELDETQQKSLVEQYEAAHKDLIGKIMSTAEKYIDCELGAFIVSSLADNPSIDTDEIKRLIGLMPEQYRQREAIASIEKKLELKNKTDIGMKIDDFTMGTPDGGEMNAMSEIAKNKITILDFWASWCGPCRQEMPFMVNLYEKYHSQGLGIIGISLDQTKEDWTKAIAELGITWPQMSDLKYWQSAAAEAFQVQAIPYMVVVNSEGKILTRGLRGEELEAFVSQNLQ